MRKWPRGVSKSAVDAWDRDLGPSLSLLRRYRQGGVDWEAYRKEYEAEMKEKPEKLRALAQRAAEGTVTLLCACRDESRCHRSVLKRLVEGLGR
jgi:uncharacterized protein YeaO (DUF488 family)